MQLNVEIPPLEDQEIFMMSPTSGVNVGNTPTTSESSTSVTLTSRVDPGTSTTSEPSMIVAPTPKKMKLDYKNKIQNEILKEIRNSNEIIQRELEENRKLTEEMARKEDEFNAETLKFQREFLDIIRSKK